MALTTCRSPAGHAGLSRDHELRVADGGTSAVQKIFLGVLLGVLLALAGILSGPPQSVDRFAAPEDIAPPQIAVDRDGPWNDAR